MKTFLSRSLFMDSQYKWSYSALTLPLNRKRFVQSKFLLLYLSLIIGFIISVIISYVYYLITKEALREPQSLFLMIILAGLSYNMVFMSLGILLNFIYENGKYLLSLVYLIPLGIGFLIFKVFHFSLDFITEDLIDFSPLLAFVFSFIIYLITVRVFEHRDL